jgi:excisionase family DNA binding protein
MDRSEVMRARSYRLPLPPHKIASRQVHRVLEWALRDWRIEGDAADAARVVLSELVTNALTHSLDVFGLALHLEPDQILVEVWDGADGMPYIGLPSGLSRQWAGNVPRGRTEQGMGRPPTRRGRQDHMGPGSEMKDAPDDELLRPREAAEIFGVRPTTIARWARQGRMTPLHTPGGHRRYRRSGIRDLLTREAHTTEQRTAEDAARLYDQGWSIRQVADRFECGYGIMRRILRKQVKLRT